MSRRLGMVLAVPVSALLLLVLWPAPYTAHSWRPQPRPVVTTVDDLGSAQLWALGKIKGPEDVAVDAQGRVYSGLADGRIVRIVGDQVQTLAHTGGRPLGLVFADPQHLYVCDAWRGLLRVGLDGQVEVLTQASAGLPFGFTDDLDVGADGRVYFTDASSRWHQPDYMQDLLEGRPYGRLLVYDPRTRQTRTLLQGLYFANGVAMARDGRSLLVVESFRYRLRRYWLQGPRAGQSEIFADNLPGIPDNVDVDEQGHAWVALPTPRRLDIDLLMSSSWLRERLAVLPASLLPGPTPIGLVAELDAQGHLLRLHRAPGGERLRMITSALPYHGRLLLGSLENDRVGWAYPTTH